ncbi:MAG TPA: DNA repair protein RadC [Flavobacteriaceae bacterium]|nr:DNA repair protein RadC [Flavobacteriaceae bacterium]
MEENLSFSIKNWNEDDRPREKLLLKGRLALSDAELIAILIGSGSRNESAVALSQRILAKASNNLNALGKFTIEQLMTFKGIGEAKAVTIAAAMELGRRRRAEERLVHPKLTSSRAVYEFFLPFLAELPHEEFWMVMLNNSNRVIRAVQISKGGITGTYVDVRVVFKEAVSMNAVGIIIAHNHPSGMLKPSDADIRLTKKIKAAGEILDIRLLDHVIITENTYFSFADEHLL